MHTCLLEIVRADDAADPHLLAHGVQHYLVRAPGGVYSEARLTWDDALRADLRAARHTAEAAQRVGDRLARFLASAGWPQESAAIEAACRADETVEVVLRAAAAELYSLPWDLLTVPGSGRRLSELPGVLLRYAWPGSTTTPRAPVERRQRLCFAWSAAGGGVPAAGVLAHLDALPDFEPRRDTVAHASMSAIEAALEPDVAVLQVLAHGAPIEGGFGLCLDEGAVDAAALRRALAPYAASLRLVILTTCHGASSQVGAHLGSLAQALHRAGIEAVIGARAPLSVSAAIALTASLYPALYSGASLAEALKLAVKQAKIFDVQLWTHTPAHRLRPLIFRPYRGLLPFEARHQHFFFGRDAEQAAVLAGLEALGEAGRPRFMVVAGASGTGKSSVVRAGVLPALSDSGHAISWQPIVMRPGHRPVEALSAALAVATDGPRVLIVDQFEELFTLTQAPDRRADFVARLWEMASAADETTGVVLTIRVDFLGRCGELVLDDAGNRLDRVAYDDAHRVFVAQMAPEQLRMAIEQPAKRVGLRFEPGLVDRILDDVAQEPGALPLLSYALDQLWRARSGDVLTQQAYVEMGGVTGALHGQADALIAGLPEAERQVARALFSRLVTVGRGGVDDTRSRQRIDDVRPADGAVFERVLSTLVSARLLVRAEEDGMATIEVAHEALIRQWPTLRAWIDADREKLIAVAEVDAWVPAWRQYGALIDGNALGYAARVRDRYPDTLSADSLALIAASAAAHAAAAHRRRRRTQLAGVAAALMGVLAIVSFLLWRGANEARDLAEAATTRAEGAGRLQVEAAKDARKQRDRARYASIVAGARTLMKSDPVTAGLLMAELPIDRPDQLPSGTYSLVHQVARITPPRVTFSPNFTIEKLFWTSDDNLLVVGHRDVELRDVHGRLLRDRVECEGSRAMGLLRHPKDEWFITHHENGRLCQWDTAMMSARPLPTPPIDVKEELRLTPDGSRIWYDYYIVGERYVGTVTVGSSRLGPTYTLQQVDDPAWFDAHRFACHTRSEGEQGWASSGPLRVYGSGAPFMVKTSLCGTHQRVASGGRVVGQQSGQAIVCQIMGRRVRRIWSNPTVAQIHFLVDGSVALLAREMPQTSLKKVWLCPALPPAGWSAFAEPKPTSMTDDECKLVAKELSSEARLSTVHDQLVHIDDGPNSRVLNVTRPELAHRMRYQASGWSGLTAGRAGRRVVIHDEVPKVIGDDGFVLPAAWGDNSGDVAFSLDERFLALRGPRPVPGRGQVGIWTFGDPEPRRLPSPVGAVYAVAGGRSLSYQMGIGEVGALGAAEIFAPDGTSERVWKSVIALDEAREIVVTASGDTVRFWSFDGGQIRPEVNTAGPAIWAWVDDEFAVVSVHEQPARLVSLSQSGGPGIKLPDTESGHAMLHGRLQSLGPDGDLIVRDPATFDVLSVVSDSESKRIAQGADSVAWATDDALIVQSLEDGEIILRVPRYDSQYFRYEGGGRTIVLGDKTTHQIWHVGQRTMARVEIADDETSIIIAVSSDGQLALGRGVVKCFIWDLSQPSQPRATFECPRDWIVLGQLFEAPMNGALEARIQLFVDLATTTEFRLGTATHLKAEGRELSTFRNGDTEIHRLGWADLIAHLRARTMLCLTADQRTTWLAEDQAEAKAAVAECEAKARSAQ